MNAKEDDHVLRAPAKLGKPRTNQDDGPDYSNVRRNLGLELVRVTEAAALKSARWLGKGDKEAADQAAVDAMRHVLGQMEIEGTIVIGEGEKDEAPMLYAGERFGDASLSSMDPYQLDIAVDPLDGTTLTAQGRNGAASVIAVAERGCLLDPMPCTYMEKFVVGPAAVGKIDLNDTVTMNLYRVAKAMDKPMENLIVAILARSRHEELIRECRQAGVHVRLFNDGDVEMSIAAAMPSSDADVMIGIGGSPEGVISACALKCLDGEIQARLVARTPDELERAMRKGIDLNRVLTTDDLCSGKEVYVSFTGVSPGSLVQGVQFTKRGAITHSMVMRSSSGSIRFLETHHRFGSEHGLENLPSRWYS